VLFLILLLVISVAGMSGLLWAKHYELTSGNMLFAGSRPALSKVSARVVFLFGTALPLYISWQARRAWHMLAAWLQRSTAHGVLLVEGWLERVLNSVREKTADSRAPGEASAFLREVGEYKKKLKK
jgi:hypothetical protein